MESSFSLTLQNFSRKRPFPETSSMSSALKYQKRDTHKPEPHTLPCQIPPSDRHFNGYNNVHSALVNRELGLPSPNFSCLMKSLTPRQVENPTIKPSKVIPLRNSYHSQFLREYGSPQVLKILPDGRVILALEKGVSDYYLLIIDPEKGDCPASNIEIHSRYFDFKHNNAIHLIAYDHDQFILWAKGIVLDNSRSPILTIKREGTNWNISPLQVSQNGPPSFVFNVQKLPDHQVIVSFINKDIQIWKEGPYKWHLQKYKTTLSKIEEKRKLQPKTILTQPLVCQNGKILVHTMDIGHPATCIGATQSWWLHLLSKGETYYNRLTELVSSEHVLPSGNIPQVKYRKAESYLTLLFSGHIAYIQDATLMIFQNLQPDFKEKQKHMGKGYTFKKVIPLNSGSFITTKQQGEGSKVSNILSVWTIKEGEQDFKESILEVLPTGATIEAHPLSGNKFAIQSDGKDYSQGTSLCLWFMKDKEWVKRNFDTGTETKHYKYSTLSNSDDTCAVLRGSLASEEGPTLYIWNIWDL